MNSRLYLLLFFFSIIIPLSQSYSSIVFPLSGNTYPRGLYWVKLQIGNPPKSYDLDIDTGSDFTWLECDAPCTGCTLPIERQYKPKSNFVLCSDPVCLAYSEIWPKKRKQPHCPKPTNKCDYELIYLENSSSKGALVNDEFTINLINGSRSQRPLTFGCASEQSYSRKSVNAGLLGIGRGKTTILTQLVSAGFTRNIVGHCLSSNSGGFLFFGEHLIPKTTLPWTPITSPDKEYSYTAGPSELLYNGKPTGLKDRKVIFDTGTSYTFLTPKTYQTILKLIRNDLQSTQLKDTKDNRFKGICWKGAKPFKSVIDVKNFFKTITIKFTNGGKITQFQIPPESYLIITEAMNVCLGIREETDFPDTNIIGAISMQGIMMIFDNEKNQFGWVSTDCNKLPKSRLHHNDIHSF